MNYEKKYKEALANARQEYNTTENVERKQWLEELFPELKESGDEKIRKALINLFKIENFNGYTTLNGIDVDDVITWLEKQKTSEEAIKYLEENHSPSEISDFQAAMNIAVAKAYDRGRRDAEKQGEKPKKISIWKHWKDGIAGNGNGEQTYLIKTGNIYDISSCLGCECDYIELSELDNLLQGKQRPKWTDDDEQYLLVCKNALRKYQVSDKWDADIISKWLEDKLKQGEQKPAWSEEDELLALSIEHVMNCASLLNIVPEKVDKIRTWIKSLKQRMEGKV